MRLFPCRSWDPSVMLPGHYRDVPETFAGHSQDYLSRMFTECIGEVYVISMNYNPLKDYMFIVFHTLVLPDLLFFFGVDMPQNNTGRQF